MIKTENYVKASNVYLQLIMHMIYIYFQSSNHCSNFFYSRK